METFIKLAISAVIGYLLGSISFAVIMSKTINKKDVRDYGSGNAGATNVARVFGMRSGIATFLCDGLKTAAAMLIGRLICGYDGYLIAAVGCLIGHCYPVFFNFRGGKGVSVSAFIGLMLDWRLFLLLCVVFFGMFILTHRVSVCSLSCALAFTPLGYLVGLRGIYEILVGVAVCLCVIVMHRSNIKRLIAGTEPRFKAGGK